MSDSPVIIYGASGHGKVVADILRACGVETEGFVDDELSVSAKVLGNGKWLAEQAVRRPISVALGVGDNFIRRDIADRCVASGMHLFSAIHPSATIAPSAKISTGVVIMPHAVVNADAEIGQGAIINTAAIIEHDCKVGSFVHLSPKSAIGGHVQVGDLSWLGMGATVIPNIKVGTYSIVGAGATVVRDVDDWVVVAGTPARILRELARRI